MKKLLYLLLSLLPLSQATARWADLKEASARYDLWRVTHKVERDGSYTTETEIQAQLLKESAVHQFGDFRLIYNGKSQKIEVLSAEVTTDGKRFPVNLQLIEDKPLASASRGFDQIRQIRVAFPRLQTGSHVSIHYRHHFKIVPFRGFFSHFEIFENTFLKTMSLKVESALPLFYKINDPDRFFKVKRRIHKNNHVFHLTLRKPLLKSIVDERSAFPDPDLFPWVEISTAKSWTTMVKHLLPEYEKIIESPLPKLHEDILNSARKIKTGPEDQIEFVLSALIEKIRYFRDWQAVNGGHIPRALSVIADTGFGDCKDLSVSLSAILRKLGWTAQTAFIHRGAFRHSGSDFKMPNARAFNHAVVRAKTGKKVFWLDPTNRVSSARNLFEDIVDRPALILKKDNAELSRTPKLQSKGSEYRIVQNFEVTKTNQIKVTGSLSFKGRSAISFTGAELYQSRKSLNYEFIQLIGTNPSTLNKWEVQGYDLTSRLVKDFSVGISYTLEKNSGPFSLRTQLGPVFHFPRSSSSLNPFDVRVKDRVSGLFLSQPRRMVLISKLKNAEPAGNDVKLNCRLGSPWADFSRTMESLKPLTVKDIYLFKQPQVSSKELKSKTFRQFQKGIKDCFKNFLMVYKKTQKRSL